MSPMHRGCARVGNPSQQGRLAGAPVCGGHPQLLQDPHHQHGGDRGQGKAANIQGSSANMQQQQQQKQYGQEQHASSSSNRISQNSQIVGLA